ncbi:MAG: TraR/DksA family transcriptional regulator [Betaproteobacteria bacterium]|nr:TraR/DksA family transcriptional regulator [Betaproteobacteria bacterium]
MAALTHTQLEQLTRQLKADYQALLNEVRDELENTGDQRRIDLLNAEPGDTGDESMATALADFNLTILDRHIDAMRDVEAALQRVRNGEYGTCIDCGNEIGFTRLRAYPTAKRCIVCQEQREKHYAQEGHPKM